jgi:Na+/H+ antiporter NhaD/arsenite permease-like protein
MGVIELTVVIIFILGYLAITLEHNLKIDKLVPALLMMGAAWAVVAVSHLPVFEIISEINETTGKLEGKLESNELESILIHHFGKTCEILIFLIGAMTIVEIIDYFDGFSTIKKFIKTNKKRKLLWIVAILAFILSAIIDNLTATIVLITILRKLVTSKEDRLWFTGMIIITANAGGAWSPIGDVTTTMLWMGEKVTTLHLIKYLILPSLACMAVPTFIASYLPAFKGEFEAPISDEKTNPYGARMLYIGLLLIVAVPVFKTLTHLPPYMGMMLSLGIFTIFAEYFSNRTFSLADNELHHSPVHRALGRIEMPSLLFFLGILMTVAALESLGMIFKFGEYVVAGIGTNPFILILGGASAIVDNVPLVAASMGMFPNMGIDAPEWHLIAYAAGTGGSMLIIGSAAGVVAMGMEKISFFWYFKKIAWLALVGYIAGIGVFYLMHL